MTGIDDLIISFRAASRAGDSVQQARALIVNRRGPEAIAILEAAETAYAEAAARCGEIIAGLRDEQPA